MSRSDVKLSVYRSDIDGLRAIAVILYHAQLALLAVLAGSLLRYGAEMTYV